MHPMHPLAAPMSTHSASIQLCVQRDGRLGVRQRRAVHRRELLLSCRRRRCCLFVSLANTLLMKARQVYTVVEQFSRIPTSPMVSILFSGNGNENGVGMNGNAIVHEIFCLIDFVLVSYSVAIFRLFVACLFIIPLGESPGGLYKRACFYVLSLFENPKNETLLRF